MTADPVTAMGDGASEARRLALVRLAHAAGAAFGCEDETAAPPARTLAAPTAIALAALATLVAAAIGYLV